MSRDKKIVILISVGSFLAGFFFVFEGNSFKNKNEITSQKKSYDSVVSTTKKAISRPAEYFSGKNYADLSKKLQGNLTSDDCARLFEEEFDFIKKTNTILFITPKMYLILQKWGEVAPRQALEKITIHENANHWVGPLFSSWAKKNPEAAVAFYAESQDRFVGKNPAVLYAISSQWAQHAPEKAWEWLQAQKGKKAEFGRQFLNSEDSVVSIISYQHPEKALAFLKNLDADILERNAYVLGQNGEKFSPGSDEWMNKLSEKSRSQAEAGRIMAQTKGDLDEIKKQISTFDEEKQKILAQNLSYPLLEESRLDIRDRIDWIMDFIPEESLPDITDFFIKKHLLEDKANAEKWLDSLPPGKKKDRLLEYLKPEPPIPFYPK